MPIRSANRPTSATSATSISATAIRRRAASATSTIMSTISPPAARSPTVAFSDLNENVYSGGIDLAYRLSTDGADHAVGRLCLHPDRPHLLALPVPIFQRRTARCRSRWRRSGRTILLSDYNIYTFNIQLRDVSGAEGTAAYEAGLSVHARLCAGRGARSRDGLRATVGVRYEDGRADRARRSARRSSPTQPRATPIGCRAVDVTWKFAPRHAAPPARARRRSPGRSSASSRRRSTRISNPTASSPATRSCVDSQLLNAEARYEYYFAPRPALSLAGFYKKIDNPIEAAAFFAGGGQLRTGFANAPRAELYGAEIEVQTYVPLDRPGRQLLRQPPPARSSATTPTPSRAITADDSMIIGPDLQPVAANLLFRDGAPLTGQSDHLANLQVGIEDTDRAVARRPSCSAMPASGSPIAARSRVCCASRTSSSGRACGSISWCVRRFRSSASPPS